LTVNIEGSELLVDAPFREIVEEATERFSTLDLLLQEETIEECFLIVPTLASISFVLVHTRHSPLQCCCLHL
jgi:hypothetical protein